MTLWRSLGILLLAVGASILSGCGTNGELDDNGNPLDNVAFTPLPTATPVPKQCGDGVVNQEVGEQCDAPDTSACGAGESCVCCLCLRPGQELGERVFSIARPPSAFLTSALAGADPTTEPWLRVPITLKAGQVDPDPNLGEEACSAPLSLAEDAIFGFNVVDGSIYCNKLFADGSGGSIDCDGGTAHDVEFSQNSNGRNEEDPPVVTTGLGNPIIAGPGAATLTIGRFVAVNIPFDPASPTRNATNTCQTEVDYDNPTSPEQVARYKLKPSSVIDVPIALTTKTGTAIVTTPFQGGNPVTLASTGENFACNIWTQEDTKGRLVAPLTGLDQIVGDTANMTVLSDK